MNIIAVATLLLPSLPDPETLRNAAAVAFGVPIDDVSVGDYYGGVNPFPAGYRVYLNLLHDDAEGDLPVAFDQKIDEHLAPHLEMTTQRLAERLGMVIVTDDSESDHPSIHRPDGITQQRFLASLPDGGLLLPTDIKTTKHPARAA